TVVFRSTDTTFERCSTMARSGLLSRLKSPTTTDSGLAAVAKSWLRAKLGVVAPGTVVLSRIDTVLALESATARSGSPSPLRPPTGTGNGRAPGENGCWVRKRNDVEPPSTPVNST